MKGFVFSFILLLSLNISAAEVNVVKQLIEDVTRLGGHPEVTEERADYVRVQLTESSYAEMLEQGDSIILIQTVCAPECSSCARVFNKEWKFLYYIEPTIKSIFPLASFDEGQVVWLDNNVWEY